MKATQTIRVLSSLPAHQALYKANVPTFVIEKIVGTEQPADASLNVEVDWLGKPTIWCLPAEAVEIVTKH